MPATVARFAKTDEEENRIIEVEENHIIKTTDDSSRGSHVDSHTNDAVIPNLHDDPGTDDALVSTTPAPPRACILTIASRTSPTHH